MVSRSERDKARKKLEIMEAAEASEFTRKTLYAYFQNKADLYRQVFLNISIQRWNFLVEKMNSAENGIPRIRAFGQANYEYTIANPEHFKMIVHIDQKGVQPQAHDKTFQLKINDARKEIQQLLRGAYSFGQDEGNIRSDLNVGRNIVHLSISLRAMLNEIVLGYEDREFYFDFLELFIKAIKN
ncbi:TetR/AcrR family transcriptional regulator [Candidatus Cloacimonadota bacterium]